MSEKPKPDDFMAKVFAYINSITQTKRNLMFGPEEEKFYEKARFMIHKGLSYHMEIIPILAELNTHQWPARIEYEFLLDAVEKTKRRTGAWHKKGPASVYLNTVMRYYGYNETKAAEVIKLLSVEQLVALDKKIRKEDEVGKPWPTCSGASE